MAIGGVKLTGQWDEVFKRLGRLNRLTKDNIQAASRINAEELEKRIKRTIRRGDPGWEPLSPLTSMRKGHDTPLRDTGALEAAIEVTPINRTDLLIGVRRGARTKSGANLLKIAMAMEFGKITRPKKAQVLAIPVSREAQEMELNYGGIRNIPGLFHPKGTRVLAIKEGKSLNILFILSDYTISPPRSYIVSTFRRYKRYMIARYKTALRYSVRGMNYGQ